MCVQGPQWYVVQIFCCTKLSTRSTSKHYNFPHRATIFRASVGSVSQAPAVSVVSTVVSLVSGLDSSCDEVLCEQLECSGATPPPPFLPEQSKHSRKLAIQTISLSEEANGPPRFHHHRRIQCGRFFWDTTRRRRILIFGTRLQD